MFIGIIVFIFGAAVGSFLSCWISRIHAGKSVVTGRSCCMVCHRDLFWYELIPVVSFLIQRGRCRECHMRIARQDIVIELIMGALFVGAYFFVAPLGITSSTSMLLIMQWTMLSILVAVFVYDFRWQIIPDTIMVPGILLFIVLRIVGALMHDLALGAVLMDILVASIVGGGFFLLQFVVSRGRWIGGGDIRLGVFMGIVLGWPQIVTALMIAYLLGAVVAVVILLLGKKKFSSQIAFGTFLTVATVITWYAGDHIVSWYLNLL